MAKRRRMHRDQALKLLRGGPDDLKLWNRLQRRGLEIPDLREVNLRGAHLEGAYLREVHLEGANLREAHLEGAGLVDAHLEGADLRFAHLKGAVLVDACLERADLHQAHLEEANLWEAHLEGADLSDAHLEGADLREANLSNASVTNVIYDRRKGQFQGIRVATCYGNALFKRDAEDQDYIETVEAKASSDTESVRNRIAELRRGVMQGRWQWWKKRILLCRLTYHERARLWGRRFLDLVWGSFFKGDAQHHNSVKTRAESIFENTTSLRNQIAELRREVVQEHWHRRQMQNELWKLTYYERAMLWGHRCWLRVWEFTDYGRSLGSVVFIAFGFAALFGLIYYFNPGMLDYKQAMGSNKGWWFTPFYYSIVTYTTLGFGDVTPITRPGIVLVTIEVIMGYVTLGLLVSILANKVARRS